MRTLDEESAHRSVLVVSVPDTGTGSPLQCVPRVEGPAEDPVGEALEESGGGRAGSRSGTSLPTGGAARRYVLDFLSTTDVGRLFSAEEDAGSEVSEWERRERREREEEKRLKANNRRGVRG